MVLGIFLGLAAASSQSLSYLFSRLFVRRFHESAVVLLVLSHIIMGLFSLVLLPFAVPEQMPAWSDYALPLLGSAVFYLLGQLFLFMALRKSAASRASPLLGLKVFILAMISLLFLGQEFSTFQWAAVILSVSAAGMLNWSGGRMPWSSVLWILAACLGYSFSDLSIKQLVGSFIHLGLSHASVLSVFLCYILCGVISLALWAFLPKVTRKMWVYAAPFAAIWLLAMLFLFACFGQIGVVFGNIVQSTRGIISILLGSWVASAGWIEIEEKLTSSVLVRRIGAACLMVAAIALFYLGAR